MPGRGDGFLIRIRLGLGDEYDGSAACDASADADAADAFAFACDASADAADACAAFAAFAAFAFACAAFACDACADACAGVVARGCVPGPDGGAECDYSGCCHRCVVDECRLSEVSTLLQLLLHCMMSLCSLSCVKLCTSNGGTQWTIKSWLSCLLSSARFANV